MNTLRTRLTIGRDEMSGFAGLSCGDLFAHESGIYELKISSYGLTLRPAGEPLGKPLEGFCELPDYFAFVRAVNEAKHSY